MKIIVAAGTGFIGKALVDRLLGEHHSVVVLTRNPAKVKIFHPHLIIELWDAQSLGPWSEHFESADAVINLTGESIAGKHWSRKRKELILQSRVLSSKVLVKAIERSEKKPTVLINMSGVGYYGSVLAGDVDESFSRGNDFLADVCHQWEQAAYTARNSNIRVVILRLGVVLANDGGALKQLIIPFKFFIGGYLGSGTQWLPWVHQNDLVNAILFTLSNPSVSGPVNVVAPEPVTMKMFCTTLGKVIRRPSWTFVPASVLRLIMGEMAEMLLTGQRVIPKRLTDLGFQFEFPLLRSALNQIFYKPTKLTT
jgi:hypothetical protein